MLHDDSTDDSGHCGIDRGPLRHKGSTVVGLLDSHGFDDQFGAVGIRFVGRGVFTALSTSPPFSDQVFELHDVGPRGTPKSTANSISLSRRKQREISPAMAGAVTGCETVGLFSHPQLPASLASLMMIHGRDGEFGTQLRIVRTIGRIGWKQAGIANLTKVPRDSGGRRLLNLSTWKTDFRRS